MTVKTKKRKASGQKKKHTGAFTSVKTGTYKLYNGVTCTLSLMQRSMINTMVQGNTFKMEFPNIECLDSLMNTHAENPLIEKDSEVFRIWDLADGTLLNSIGFCKEKYLMEVIERTNDQDLIARKFLQESGMIVRWAVQLDIHMYELDMTKTAEEQQAEKLKLSTLDHNGIALYMLNRNRNYGTNTLEFDLPATPLWVYGIDEIDGVEYDNIQMMRTDGKMVKGEEYMKNPITFLEKCLNVVGESLSDEESYGNYELHGLTINAVVKGL